MAEEVNAGRRGGAGADHSSRARAGGDPTAFPTLDPRQIALLDALGTRRHLEKGELLYREGDAASGFYVVLVGEMEGVAGTGDDEQLMVRHRPGNFLGELNLLTGQRVFVTARVAQAG